MHNCRRWYPSLTFFLVLGLHSLLGSALDASNGGEPCRISVEKTRGALLFEQSRYPEAQPLLAELSINYLENKCADLSKKTLGQLRSAIHRQKPSSDLQPSIDKLVQLARANFSAESLIFAIALDVKGTWLRRNRKHSQAAVQHKLALAIKEKLPQKDPTEIAFSSLLLAKALRLKRDFPAAKKCLRQIGSGKGVSPALQMQLATEWGWFWIYPKFQPDSTKAYLQQAVALSKTIYPDPNSLELWPLEELKGRYNLEIGDSEKGAEAYQRCLFFCRKYDLGFNYEERFLRAIAAAYSRRADIEKALDLYRQLQDLLEKQHDSEFHEEYASLYNNLSALHHHLEKYTESIQYLRKRASILQTIHPEDHPLLAEVNTYLAEDLLEVGKLDSARACLSTASAIAQRKSLPRARAQAYLDWMWGKYYWMSSSYGKSEKKLLTGLEFYLGSMKRPDEKSRLYLDLAQLRMRQGRRGAAMQMIQHSIAGMALDFEASDYHTNPSLSQPFDKRILLKALQLKAQFLSTSPEKDDRYLAISTYSLALRLIDLWRHDLKGEQSKLIIAAVSRPIYEEYLNLTWKLHESYQDPSLLDTAFKIMEKGKANLLLESISDEQALRYAEIPDSLVELEAELRSEINYWAKELWYAQNHELQDSLIKEYRNRLFSLEDQLEDFSRSLEREYPAYYSFKYDIDPANLEWVQRHALKDKSAMVEYFLGDSSLYLIGINKEKAELIRLPVEANFLDQVKVLRKNLTHYQPNTELYAQFVASARSLYKQLLEPLEGIIGEGSLCIVPDGILHYISFETLLTRDPQTQKGLYRDLPYLIRKQPVSYQYSATLLKEINKKQRKQEASPSYLGFAPDFSSKFPVLNGAKEGVSNIESNYGNSAAFVGKEATKDNFYKTVQNYRILHLATHAIILDKDPMYSHFLFSGYGSKALDSLFTYELYTMQLEADLAILEACNTGAGTLARGEGVMSMARGFFHMGYPSIIMSLWEIPDGVATPMILEELFKNFSKGLPKDEALRQAKLYYLDHVGTASYTHPALWSELVLIGDNSPLPIKGNSFPIYWLFAALLLVPGIYFLLRKTRKGSR